MFKLLTEKHRTVKHMIIFNDSSVAFEAFAKACLLFSMYLDKKNAEVIKFLAILNMSPRIKKKEFFCDVMNIGFFTVFSIPIPHHKSHLSKQEAGEKIKR